MSAGSQPFGRKGMRMQAVRAVLVAAAVAVVVLVVPATGQGKAADPPVLFWSHTLHGPPPPITSYDFGAVKQQDSTWFRLGDTSTTRTGKLKITLEGSAAFTITEDRCSPKHTIGKYLSCWVGVAYTPAGSFASDTAVLTAKASRGGAPASLDLSGRGWAPSAPRR